MNTWYSIKTEESQEVDFSSPSPSFKGIYEGKEVEILLNSNHTSYYNANADTYSVKGQLVDGKIEAEQIKSYNLKSVNVNIGHIDRQEDYTLVTGYDNQDRRQNQEGKEVARRYFIKIKESEKENDLTKDLKKGDLFAAKGYVFENNAGDRLMNMISGKLIVEKNQAKD
ncbi:MAG: hypothetical protein RJQ14_25720, partial [Marinoscillum sp.]